MIAKMAEEGTPKIHISIKTMKKKKEGRINFFGTLENTQNLALTWGALLEKCLNLGKPCGILTYHIPSPMTQLRISLKNNNLHSWYRYQREKNETHLQRVTIIWFVWWFPRGYAQKAWISGLVQKLLPGGHLSKIFMGKCVSHWCMRQWLTVHSKLDTIIGRKCKVMRSFGK